MIPPDLLRLEILQLFAEAAERGRHLPKIRNIAFRQERRGTVVQSEMYAADLRRTKARGYDVQTEQNLRASLRRGVRLATCAHCGQVVELREGNPKAQHVATPFGRCPKLPPAPPPPRPVRINLRRSA